MEDYMPYYNGYEEEPQKPGAFKRFFFACAGAYIRILEIAPSEHTKYVGIGATILLTACMAVISGSFAIYTLVENVVVSVLFGLLWGALIFNLDRYIVSSIRKEGRTWHELGLAMPRLLLAVVISLVITKPIEIELFSNQLDSELLIHTARLEKESEMELDRSLGLDSIRRELAYIDSVRWQYKQLKEGKPSSFDFNEASGEYTRAKATYDSLYRLYMPTIKANDKLRGDLWNNYATKVYETGPDGEQRFVRWNFPQKWQDQSNDLYRTNQRLQKVLDEHGARVEGLDKMRKGARAAFAEQLDEEIRLLQTRREDLEAARVEREAIRKEQIPQARESARRYAKGFPARIQALEQLKQKDGAIWWTSNLIVLLFMLLETSPVFVKLISKRGPYDYLLSRIEHHKKIESLRSISDMNYDLSTAMRLQSQRNQAALNGQRYEEEVYSE
ncbi:MAG: hypothetical protein OHK0039_46880 [Bacteroidia bacterium]